MKKKRGRPKKEVKENVDTENRKQPASVSDNAPKHRAMFFSCNNIFRG